MNHSSPKDSHWSLGTFGLYDIAIALIEAESGDWGEDSGANLFLEESLQMVKREAENMALLCGQRTGERARVYSVVGYWSTAFRDANHYENLAKFADVWIIGVPDCDLDIAGVVAVPVPRGGLLQHERGVVVESNSFGCAMFSRVAGLLNPDDPKSAYYEGLITVRQDAVEIAAGRIASVLKLSSLAKRWVDYELVTNWYSRLNRLILETLEASRLQLRAKEDEVEKMLEEQDRLEKLVRGYVGGETWREVRDAMSLRQEDVADREREEVTVCFCDLVGFTKLSERLTPTEVAQILNDHFSRLYNIVRVHGGTVDKFIGDAILAYFPSPIEAFEAAKKMVQESRSVRLNNDWTLPIQVRVGLNTGFVAIANLGVPEMRQRTILGETVNFAQRMQSAAAPHSVLISDKTLRVLPHSLIRSVEPVQVQIKGRREPVEAYLWTLSTERRERVHDQLSLRTGLMATSQRSSLADRLKRSRE
jgi:class 3 adenylate cyclase